MQNFPHLRVVGKKINLPLRPQTKEDLRNYEEIIIIDPPPSQFKVLDDKLEQELSEKLSLRRSRQPSNQLLKVDDLDKLLRITSSGLTRNHQQQIRQTKKVDRTSTFFVKQNSVGLNFRKLSKIQEHKKFELSPLSFNTKSSLVHCEKSNINKVVKSAQNLNKIADFSNEKNDFYRQKLPKNEFSSKSAQHKNKSIQLQQQLYAPAVLNFNPFFEIRGGRFKSNLS